MRVVSLVSGFAVAVSLSSAAMAYENYIPLGTGYSTNVDSLPTFDSNAGEISSKTDIYETEIYMLNRKKAEQDSQLRRFFSDSESTVLDRNIDY